MSGDPNRPVDQPGFHSAVPAPTHTSEIEASLRRALERLDLVGAVLVRGTTAELHGRGTPVAIDVGPLVEQWSLLPDDARARRIEEVARRLAAAHGGARGGSARPSSVLPPRVIALPIGGLVLGALIAVALFKILKEETPKTIQVADGGVPADPAQQVVDRNARGCEAGRKRIYSGASLGPFDTDGWVAELWLARPGGEAFGESPELAKFVSGGRLLPGADEALGVLKDGSVEIIDGPASAEGASAAWRSIVLRFGGRYVSAFLDPQERPRLLALSDRLAVSLAADVGALYARCAHLGFHDMGAWFRGSNPSAAAAALVYGMGLSAEAPAVDRTALAAKGPDPLDALRGAAREIDAAALGRLVGAQGGGITNGAGGALTITFPSGGGTRATSASRTLARKLGVGIGSD